LPAASKIEADQDFYLAIVDTEFDRTLDKPGLAVAGESRYSIEVILKPE
jgi:hypothetical protein